MLNSTKECQIVGDFLARLLAREFGVQTAFVWSQLRKAHQKKRSRLQQSWRPHHLRRRRYRRRPSETFLFPVPPRRHLCGQVAFFRVRARQAAP